MRAYSRQRERRGRDAALVFWVVPGRKSLGREDERFDQAGHEELSLQPGQTPAVRTLSTRSIPTCCAALLL